jgi:hypothetical protein
MLVCRSQRFSEHVLNASSLKYSSHRFAGYDTGTWGCGAKKNFAAARTANDLMRDRSLLDRHANHVSSAALRCFPNRFWHFPRLAQSNAYTTFAVAYNNHSVEAPVASTFGHLGDGLDVYHILHHVHLVHAAELLITVATTTAPAATLSAAASTTTAAATSAYLSHAFASLLSRYSSKDQTLGPCAFGKSLDTSVVEIAVAIEHDFGDSQSFRLSSDLATDGICYLLLTATGFERLSSARHAANRAAFDIVYHMGLNASMPT